MMAVGVLMVSGQRGWHRSYNSTQKKIKHQAQTVMLTFDSIGKKSNRPYYTIYDVIGNKFTPAVPFGSEPEEVVSGDAVEFRYWDLELADDKYLDPSNTGTAYALFYLDGDKLKVDYGPYPHGAVPTGGGARNEPFTTHILAENVSADPNIGAFSHTTLNGVGMGSVRISVTLTDPDDNEQIKVMTTTLLRNIWPR